MMGGFEQCGILLLEAGADSNCRNVAGETAFEVSDAAICTRVRSHARWLAMKPILCSLWRAMHSTQDVSNVPCSREWHAVARNTLFDRNILRIIRMHLVQ